ncbi:MAG: hypothetical protein L0Y39_02510 [Methylococcaceae bacterium]|nr:hypothetical protein [Methylococcaceae bacterium]
MNNKAVPKFNSGLLQSGDEGLGFRFGGRIWQRHFGEHFLRDQADSNRHVDYIHWNPVKHGWVNKVRDWPHSSFHRYVEQDICSENWGNGGCSDIDGIE